MKPENLSKTLGKILVEKRMTIAVAESCTGGMIGSAITAVPGASHYFLGGVIAYNNRIKKCILKVSREVINNYGVVCGQTVAAMARGVRQLMKSDCAIAVSGVAGPGGGTKKKPVGLVYIGIEMENSIKIFRRRYKGTRTDVRKRTVEEALRLLIQSL
jgi:PncC family amidohydrolase